jgi:formylglycine-generating enzyme required for sulfatase activity/tetratricopeptide (TPR) repeat protein
MTQQEEFEQRFQFLLELLQLLITDNDGLNAVNSLVLQNLELLDDQLIEAFREWERSKLVKANGDEQKAQALALVQCGDLLQQLSLGNRVVNIELSIKCYSLAAKAFDVTKNPSKWAAMQSRLAASYKVRIRGDKAGNWEFAIECYKLALSAYEPSGSNRANLELAEAQHNVAIAYRDRLQGNAAENLERSIEYCTPAQEIMIVFFQSLQEFYEQSSLPMLWAMNQCNLATAYQERLNGSRAENLELSINFFDLALKVYHADLYPEEWAKVQADLDATRQQLASGAVVDRLAIAAGLNQRLANAYYNRGILRECKLNNKSKALTDYAKAIELDPQNVELYRDRSGLGIDQVKPVVNEPAVNDSGEDNSPKEQVLSEWSELPPPTNIPIANQPLIVPPSSVIFKPLVQSITPIGLQLFNLPPSVQPADPAGLQSFSFETVKLNDRGIIQQRQQSTVKGFVEELGRNVSIEMLRIPAGKFMMGQTAAEKQQLLKVYGEENYKKYFACELPQHEVQVPEFYLGQNLVTQAQYQALMGSNPSHFKGDGKLPVDSVSWLNAMDFCQKLSQKTGRTYRLPSEAEWEYACRAGTTTPFAFGETISPAIVNYNGNQPYGNAAKGEYREKTMIGGSFPANSFGLYDMHGNLWEWCLDEWFDNYNNAPADGGPKGDIKSRSGDKKRLLRGGSWLSLAYYCRSTYRYSSMLRPASATMLVFGWWLSRRGLPSALHCPLGAFPLLPFLARAAQFFLI